MPDGGSRAVELMLSMQDEQGLHDFGDLGVVGELMVITPDHVQEVLHIPERLISWNNLLPAIQPVTSSSYSRCHTQDSVNVDISLLLRVVNIHAFEGWVGLGVEGGEH